MKLKGKRKQVVLFLTGVLILSIFLFWDDVTGGKVPDIATETTKIKEQESRKESSLSKEEISKADQIDQDTSFWFWKGEVSGVKAKEYITLKGDQKSCFLVLELSGRNPEDMEGRYTVSGEDIRILINGEVRKGKISRNKMTLGDRVYKKTSCDHV